MTRPRSGLFLLLVLLGSAATATAKKAPLPSCDGLRLVVRDERLAAPAILSVKGTRVAFGNVCKEARLRLKRSKSGAVLQLAWKRCDGLKGAVHLGVVVDQGCKFVRGTLQVKGKKRGLVAAPSICGDGMIDPEKGEACEPPGGAGCNADCERTGDSALTCGTGSFETLQTALFVRHGCAASSCHGGANAGGLDLRPGAAYGSLVNAASQESPMRRIEPGDDTRSFLWWKLAKGTRGLGVEVPGAPMPNGGAAPISEDELAAVALWIKAGAPQTGVVPGVDAKLGISCDVPHVPACGDAIVDPGEACDDGNAVDGDGCSHCALPRCGDGILDLTEICDDGNTDDNDSCTADCSCDRTVTSTWPAIQQAIFRQHGCAVDACHGSSKQGGLDLRPDAAYESLVGVSSTSNGLLRVKPGEKQQSVLWLKLAKQKLGLSDGVIPGAPMPNGFSPISDDELEAVGQWIHDGAPATGVVGNTATLLDTCLPPADPIKITPPAPPATDVGVQLHAPAWDLPNDGEDEVCFATYFDLSAQIPESQQIDCPPEWGGPAKKCFYYNKTELTQDPNSHHSIIHYYRGGCDVTESCGSCAGGQNAGKLCRAAGDCPGSTCANVAPAFGDFTCHGGPMAGSACDPKGIGVAAPAGADCGAGGGCAGRVDSTIACIGYGPPDYGFDLSGLGGDNSPTIGGSQQPVSSNVFPTGVYTPLPVRGTIVWNSHAFNLTGRPTTNEQWLNLYFAGANDRTYQVSQLFDSRDIFVENVAPFGRHEFCRTHTFSKGTRLFQVSSHNHKRGRLFRVWGPGISDRCGCGGGTLAGGCSEAGRIHPKDCPAGPGDPFFTSTDYDDPTVLYFDPPLALDGDNDSRTVKFCSIYDNGADEPAHVKRQSTSPLPPILAGLENIVGGPCPNATVACLDGPNKGNLCHGNHSECDSAPGLGDGICDACPVHGGVTTEDEMFILIGLFYQVPVGP